MTAQIAQRELRTFARKDKTPVLQRFFKTGPGEYAEGDIFIGVTVPNTRTVAKNYIDLKPKDISILLGSKIHEDRLLGLMILVLQYKKANSKNQEIIFNFYLKKLKHVNNWDLVDSSARDILGAYLFDKDRQILYKLARSNTLWERRIAIIATFYFIQNNDFDDTLKICTTLMDDSEDLIHKACGWMLREVGKRNVKILKNYLKRYSKKMPRTMLRYAIERFPKNVRAIYLKN